jgi:hypothetical protein
MQNNDRVDLLLDPDLQKKTKEMLEPGVLNFGNEIIRDCT